MRYLQIRVPAESCLERVLDEILKDICARMYVLATRENFGGHSWRLQAAIKSAMDKYLHEYSNCGLAEECHDDIEGGPWVDYNDRIYLLSLPDSFDSFIKEVSEEALGTMTQEVPLETKAQLLSALSGMLSRRLAKYLYFNPSCRRIPFCELRV